MTEDERKRLWQEYAAGRNQKIKDKLIVEYSGLVKVVAGRLCMYLGYAVEMDDLIGYGVFGLIDAIDKFDPKKEIKFETYASLRIRGEILDQIRKMDWLPRTQRQKVKKFESTVNTLESELGRTPRDEEIAARMGVTADQVKDMRNQAELSGIVSLDEYLEQGSDISSAGNRAMEHTQPEVHIVKEDIRRELIEAIKSLNDQEQKVISLYYYEELSLKEISQVLDVSESRVSQIHTKALKKMKETLGSDIRVFF